MSSQDENAIAVFITTATVGEARTLAELLVKERLAACVQILPPIDSYFRWKGANEHQTEILLIAKTLSDKFADLERAVRANHSYETPEIVAVPLSAVSQPYFEWLQTTVSNEA